VFRKPDFTASMRQTQPPNDASSHVIGQPEQPRPEMPKNEHKALLIPLNKVHPDPTQPRRAIPQSVRDLWAEKTPTMSALWEAWATLAEYEHPGSTRYMRALLSGKVSPDSKWVATSPVENSLLVIVELALSIREKGLINPVTAYSADGEHYYLETGERRWLAFHLLQSLDKTGKYNFLPVIPTTGADVFRQAAENTLRKNLNMIGRARQYALLLMALNRDASLLPYSECASDRLYYAQALNLNVPRGKRKDVLAAMGVSSPGQLSRYKELLTLDDETWTRADDENWTQEQLFTEVNTTASEQENAQNPTQKPPKTQSQPPRSFVERVEKQFGDYVTRVDKLRERIRKDTKTDYSQLEPLIDKQIDELRKLKKQIKG
jgi:hypothetical protein